MNKTTISPKKWKRLINWLAGWLDRSEPTLFVLPVTSTARPLAAACWAAYKREMMYLCRQEGP